jgi:hypothetical protein
MAALPTPVCKTCSDARYFLVSTRSDPGFACKAGVLVHRPSEACNAFHLAPDR